MEMKGQLRAPAALSPENNTRPHWTGGWVSPRTSLDVVKKRHISWPNRDFNPGRSSAQPYQ